MSTDSMHIGGTKEFDWVVTPRVAGSRRGARAALSVFRSVRATVRSGGERTGRDLHRRGRARLRRHEHRHARRRAGCSAPRIAARSRRRSIARRRCSSRSCSFRCRCCCSSARAARVASACAPCRPRSRLRALARSDDTVREARTVRRTFLSAAADRLSASATVLAEPAALRQLALRAGVTHETAERAQAFVAELNAAAFDAAGEWAGDGVQRAYDLYRAIDREARPRRTAHARRAPAAMALVLALALAAGAHAADGAHALFAKGVDAYAHGAVRELRVGLRGARRARAARARRVGEPRHRRVLRGRHRARDGRLAARAPPRAARERRARSPRPDRAHRRRRRPASSPRCRRCRWPRSRRCSGLPDGSRSRGRRASAAPRRRRFGSTGPVITTLRRALLRRRDASCSTAASTRPISPSSRAMRRCTCSRRSLRSRLDAPHGRHGAHPRGARARGRACRPTAGAKGGSTPPRSPYSARLTRSARLTPLRRAR